jgi:hypothetical protein
MAGHATARSGYVSSMCPVQVVAAADCAAMWRGFDGK